MRVVLTHLLNRNVSLESFASIADETRKSLPRQQLPRSFLFAVDFRRLSRSIVQWNPRPETLAVGTVTDYSQCEWHSRSRWSSFSSHRTALDVVFETSPTEERFVDFYDSLEVQYSAILLPPYMRPLALLSFVNYSLG
jgi:hypothetical protein